MTFNNYGGHCGYEFPAWVREAAAARSTDSDLGRSRRRYNELVELQNSEARPYLHLVDGGVSDNVAMRAIVELMQAIDPNQPLVEMVPVLRPVRRVAIIIVNAVSSPSVDWGKVESPPGAIHQLFQASSVPIDRYSYESVDLLNDIVTRLALERRLAIAEARLGGATEAQPVGRPPVELYVINVSFNEIADAGERRYFQNLATSFVLPAEAVDRLREIAGRILRASPQYQRLLDALGGDPR